MPKSDPVDTGVGLLEMKIGACLNAPTRRMVADFAAAALDCNRVKTFMVRSWERWREDHPDWQPEPILRAGEPATNRYGRLLPMNQPLPPLVKAAPQPGAEGKRPRKPDAQPGAINPQGWLYQQGTAFVPHLAGHIVSRCAEIVLDRLKAKTPYNHAGEALWHWQAILDHEVGWRDSYKNGLLVPYNDTAMAFAYNGQSCGPCAERLRPETGAAAVRFLLYGAGSERRVKDYLFRVEARQLTPGNRRVLERVIAGEWKMRDGFLKFSEGKRPGSGHWVLQLVYHQPRQQLGLPAERVATLTHCGGKADNPFRITALHPDDGHEFGWWLGHARTLTQQFDRLEARRLALRSEYRIGGSGVRGHGRGRFFRDIKPVSRAARNLMERFTELLVVEIVKFCTRWQCGTILYDEPPVPARAASWFAAKGIPYDWTNLAAKLKHRCHLTGIALVSGKAAQRRAQ